MEEPEKNELLARAKRLEAKLLYGKAGEIYLSLGMEEQAAKAYETAGLFDKAILLYKKLGKKEDIARCVKKRDAGLTGSTFQSVQAEFQQDKGNPY